MCPLSLGHLDELARGGFPPEDVLLRDQEPEPHGAICPGTCRRRVCRDTVTTTELEWLAGGMTVADILADYPDLEADDIHAALAYAARLMQTNHVALLTA
jgi:Protein of unknown function (DUF433)